MFSLLDEQTLCNQWRTHFVVHLWDGFGPDKKLFMLNQYVFPFDSQIQAYDLDICGLQACFRWFLPSFFFVRHCVEFSDTWFSKGYWFSRLMWFKEVCLSNGFLMSVTFCLSDRKTKLLPVSLFGIFIMFLQVSLTPDIFLLLTEWVIDCSHWWSMQLLTVKGSAYRYQQSLFEPLSAK